MKFPQEFPLGTDSTDEEYRAKTLAYIQTAIELLNQQGEKTFDRLALQNGGHPVLKGLFNELFPENELI